MWRVLVHVLSYRRGYANNSFARNWKRSLPFLHDGAAEKYVTRRDKRFRTVEMFVRAAFLAGFRDIAGPIRRDEARQLYKSFLHAHVCVCVCEPFELLAF